MINTLRGLTYRNIGKMAGKMAKKIQHSEPP